MMNATMAALTTARITRNMPICLAPGVVVSYTTDPGIQSGKKFLDVGLQTASGVPLQCDEGADFQTFRIGLFGLDKWHNVDRTVGHLAAALDKVAPGR